MIICRMQGGLGNQMYQYALAKTIAIKNNDTFCLDVADYETYFRPFLLQHFAVEHNIADSDLCLKIRNPSFFRSIKRKICHKAGIHRVKDPCINFTYVTEKKLNKYDKSLLNTTGNIYLDGYFSTEKYFKCIRPLLLVDFTLKTIVNNENKAILEKINSSNSVSVHIRRGDYLKLQHIYTILDAAYYQKAVSYICQKTERPHFYIFSNDMEWVKTNLTFTETTGVSVTHVIVNDENTGYLDLELMKHCKHNIIANSSFSWWSAWLNSNPDKIVIRPEKMFSNTSYYEKDLYPDEWVKL